MISAMDKYTVFIVALLIQTHYVHSLWTCSKNEECSSLSGSVCLNGECVCEPGQQSALGGTRCINVAPYYSSPCHEDFQCGRLVFGFVCSKSGNSTEGNCLCQSGYHYSRGRCWRSRDFGEACSLDEECMGVNWDPFSMQCNGTCRCSDNYYERQRGQCRKAATEEGQGCVIDQDCRFENAKCDRNGLFCNSGTDSEISEHPFRNQVHQVHNDISRVRCDANNTCEKPFVCSNFGVCTCPTGYYERAADRKCLAELGSPSTPEQCVGFLADVEDGICTCRSNFFFDENMRDCIKVTRSFTDACISDAMCGTFGPSKCGPPAAPWGLRTCACVDSVWDGRQNMCRKIAGIGEMCELDSDCMAGNQEIQCLKNADGNSYCACPQGLVEHEGLCLGTGLKLGEKCQHSLECTGTDNTNCEAGICSCSDGYTKQDGNQPICILGIGGICKLNSECVIENTLCKSNENGSTCQCNDQHVEYDEGCLTRSYGYNSSCEVSVQCSFNAAICDEGNCLCKSQHHFRDGGCWPMTELFSSCSRQSECYLSEHSERTVCRNSRCQCDFNYPYSETLKTCSSSDVTRVAAILLVISAALHLHI